MGRFETADIEAHVDEIVAAVQHSEMIELGVWGEYRRAPRPAMPLSELRARVVAMQPPAGEELARRRQAREAIIRRGEDHFVGPSLTAYERHVEAVAARHADLVRFVDEHEHELRKLNPDGFEFGSRRRSGLHALLAVSSYIMGHHQSQPEPCFADAGLFVEHGLDRLHQRVLFESGELRDFMPEPPPTFERHSGKSASLSAFGKTVEVSGELQTWLLQKAWETRGEGVLWPDLLTARRTWEGQELQFAAPELENLKRSGRTLADRVNAAMGQRVLTTVDGLRLDLGDVT